MIIEKSFVFLFFVLFQRDRIQISLGHVWFTCFQWQNQIFHPSRNNTFSTMFGDVQFSMEKIPSAFCFRQISIMRWIFASNPPRGARESIEQCKIGRTVEVAKCALSNYNRISPLNRSQFLSLSNKRPHHCLDEHIIWCDINLLLLR